MAPLPVPPGCTFTNKKIREWDEIDCTELLLRLDPVHEQYLPRILAYLHFQLDGISLAYLTEKDLKNIGYHLESPMSKSLARQINNIRKKLNSQNNTETEYEITFEKPHHLGLKLGVKDARKSNALIVEKLLDSVAIDIQKVQPGEYITRVNRMVATPGGQHDLLWRTLSEAPLGRRLTLRFARAAGGQQQPPLPPQRRGAAAATAAAAAAAAGSGAGATATQTESTCEMCRKKGASFGTKAHLEACIEEFREKILDKQYEGELPRKALNVMVSKTKIGDGLGLKVSGTGEGGAGVWVQGFCSHASKEVQNRFKVGDKIFLLDGVQPSSEFPLDKIVKSATVGSILVFCVQRGVNAMASKVQKRSLNDGAGSQKKKMAIQTSPSTEQDKNNNEDESSSDDDIQADKDSSSSSSDDDDDIVSESGDSKVTLLDM